MRTFLTGHHQGYLGTVMAPIVSAAGHDVVGLDAGLFADCVLGDRPVDPPSIDVDLRDVDATQLAGFDAVITAWRPDLYGGTVLLAAVHENDCRMSERRRHGQRRLSTNLVGRVQRRPNC